MNTNTTWRVCAAVAVMALALLVGRPAVAAPALAPALQEGGVVPGIYVSETMTADDGTTFDISVILMGDSSAAMVLSSAAESVTAVGAWEEGDDATVTVTLTGAESEEFDEPVVTVFEAADDVLTAVEYDETVFGADGFSVTLSVSEEELDTAEAQGLAEEDATSGPVVSGVYSSDIVDLGAPSVWIVNFNDDGTFQFWRHALRRGDGHFDDHRLMGSKRGWHADAHCGEGAIRHKGRRDGGG